ncbi:hypothetical protein QTO34_014540 [Cnephaeus nilssonii]|uniref:Uncharacterized protein n=1 Tax=Cnephaeus nilssonii TaxID=3371016 RepID=A0AA40LU52_CNENI|nr:hypothetical protein QTO34_014540 [Eptesicus nilssonii]
MHWGGGGGGPSARPAPSHSTGALRAGGNPAIRGRRRSITPLLLPLLAAQASACPGYLRLGRLGSHHPRLACTSGRPWVAGGLRELGDSEGRRWVRAQPCRALATPVGLRGLGTAILWLWVPPSLRNRSLRVVIAKSKSFLCVLPSADLIHRKWIAAQQRKGEGRKINDERESWIGCLLHAPYWGSSPQPRYVPLTGIEPGTLQSTG